MFALQLNPPLPLQDLEGRKCLAHVMLDYGPEWTTLFLCAFDDSRELWWLPTNKLRIGQNISLGREQP